MLQTPSPKTGTVLSLFSLFSLLATLLVCHTAVRAASSADNGNGTPGTDGDTTRTWRLVSELSAEERQRLDFATNAPRDIKIPYMPAEPYPFKPPYTPEEIGFRAMEFPHMPRWNCVQIEDSGTLTPSGYLFINQIIVLVQYPDQAGLTEAHGLLALWWDPQQDFYSCGVHDAMDLREWTQADKDVFFNPDFMRRGWFPVPLKTQAGVNSPEEFYLRPHLYRDKFPTERTITLPAALEARIQAQEEAGHIVFIGGESDAGQENASNED